jgi:hypothetical protein
VEKWEYAEVKKLFMTDGKTNFLVWFFCEDGLHDTQKFYDDMSMFKAIANLGREGWEMFSVTQTTGALTHFFKRRITD